MHRPHPMISLFLILFTVSILGAVEKFTPAMQHVVDNASGEPELAWIFFADKSGGEYSAELLTERALWRRSKTRTETTDDRDIPVSEQYIQKVLSFGVEERASSRWLNAMSVSATAAQLNRIADLHFVTRIHPVATGSRIELPDTEPIQFNPVGSRDRNDYGLSELQLSQINVTAVHEAGYTGQGVIVLMLDTGYFKDHQCFSPDQILGEWDFIQDDGNTQNEEGDQENQHGHGTATWSALGGHFDGELYGPAYESQFLLAKTEDRSQEEPIEEDWYVAGLEWGEALGADVASSSLGYIDWYQFEDLDGLTAVTTIAVNTAVENGMVITTAAGNYGAGGIIAPADAFDVITCGSVDSTGTISSFSSHGPTADGRIKPEVCARGSSTYCASGTDPEGYRFASGTSLSTPLIGGVAALILSAHPEWNPRQVRASLMFTANNTETPDNVYGWGLIDALAAIELSMLPGDVDNNHVLNIVDIVRTVAFILENEIPNDYEFFQGDVNADGALDVLDILQIVNIILG